MRRGLTGAIAGGVIAVAVFAGLDVLRSSSDQPPPAEANGTEAVTTTHGEVDAPPLSSQLRTRRVVRLVPGHVTMTNPQFPIRATFTVPAGWYGYQEDGGFVIAKTPSRAAAKARNVTFGGIAVDILDRELADLVRDLKTTTQYVQPYQESAVQIAGHSGRQFALDLRGTQIVRELFGVPGFYVDDPEEQVILIGLGPNTLLIHRRSDGGDPERYQIDRILQTFEVTTSEQAVEDMGNRWAWLFDDRRCNEFMTQPACEWVVCEHVGGATIKGCKPLSPDIRRSFGGAVVEEVVVKGKRAAARFSNGVSVRLLERSGPTSWWIDRVGAGGQLFE
jgi:hypothetical protein